MTKILSGILGLFVVAMMVAGSAYALFSSQVNVSGIVLGSATPLLEIKPDLPGAAYGSSLPMPADAFGKLIPGEDDWGRFYLKNNSNGSSVDPLNFDLTARLTSAGGDWGSLANIVEAVVYVEGTTNYDTPSSNSTGWQTLAAWNAGEVDLPGSPLAQGGEAVYIIRFRLPESADNSAAGKTLQDVQFVITGTQVTPAP